VSGKVLQTRDRYDPFPPVVRSFSDIDLFLINMRTGIFENRFPSLYTRGDIKGDNMKRGTTKREKKVIDKGKNR
jgi:hypothetical protein